MYNSHRQIGNLHSSLNVVSSVSLVLKPHQICYFLPRSVDLCTLLASMMLNCNLELLGCIHDYDQKFGSI